MITVTISGHEMPISNIVAINPHKSSVCFRTNNLKLLEESYIKLRGMAILKVDSKEFQIIKFQYIRYIKTLPNPYDRVAMFEYLRPDRTPDFERMEKLVESRKRPDEREKELREETELMESFNTHKIEYFGPLRRNK